jgi:hypothetical protein
MVSLGLAVVGGMAARILQDHGFTKVAEALSQRDWAKTESHPSDTLNEASSVLADELSFGI